MTIYLKKEPHNSTLSEFDYCLPKELVAQRPLALRDSSRLLVIERMSRNIFHRKFSSLPDILQSGDCLVLNDTKVIPARLFGRKKSTGGKVELLLLERLNNLSYRAMVKPKLELNEEVLFNGGSLRCKVEKRISDADMEMMSNRWDMLLRSGEVPLPPYIRRMPDEMDKDRYQTIYAKRPGAIAAPTAGLHFTEETFGALELRGIKVAYMTLHIGYGTFKPVRCEDISQHRLEAEYFEVSEKTLKAIHQTKMEGGRIVAVGTTTCRALETLAILPSSPYHRLSGYTDLFIYPPYRFHIIDALLTNFHLPKTTLMMLVCAFAGKDLIMEAYHQAIEKRYRFYSYGDAMLII